ncbi:hypothetical protein SEA_PAULODIABOLI_200 [Microbacterium phage PauloDiaboli]|nr:hypothetical protein SEA_PAULODIABOLI_200 [Microbacterium phage PauloDiaboli]QWY84008.1 hypothetical protein SEA_A3WALLY_201 [Microbacterium phage A3Wally]
MAQPFESRTQARTTALYLAQNVLQSRLAERQGVSISAPYTADELVDEAKTIEGYILGE